MSQLTHEYMKRKGWVCDRVDIDKDTLIGHAWYTRGDVRIRTQFSVEIDELYAIEVVRHNNTHEPNRALLEALDVAEAAKPRTVKISSSHGSFQAEYPSGKVTEVDLADEFGADPLWVDWDEFSAQGVSRDSSGSPRDNIDVLDVSFVDADHVYCMAAWREDILETEKE